jgi:hypothetical protein
LSDEVEVTPPAQAEPTPAGDTAPAEAKAEPQPEPQPEPKQEPDWRAAYVGLQTNLNKSHARTAEVLRQNEALAQSIKVMKEGQTEILRATGGDDAVRAAAAREAQGLAAEAQRRAAVAATQLIEAQFGILTGALAAVGVAPNDPSIDWAQDAPDVETWKARVLPSVQARIQKANEERITKERQSITAKSQKEIEAEAEALTQRQLKAQGVDKIDTAKGSGPTSLVDRIRNLQPGTPEYRKFEQDVARGTLK